MRRMYSKPQLLEAVEQEAEVNGLKAFENIVDKDGHKRFIEGEIDIETITGVTKTYGKWSLSGSQLLIVLALEIADTTVLGTSTYFTNDIDLPQWLKDKIIPVTSGLVDNITFNMRGSDWSAQAASVALIKDDDKLKLRCLSSVTLSAKRYVRLAYNLLIDNE